MRIDHLLEHQRPVFSFEFFPPQTDEGMETLKRALYDLKDDEPAFTSVTYGAAGSTRDRTVEVTKWIKQELGIEAMAHLSCVGEDRKSTRLNSSHTVISYAVFCLKKKNKNVQ